MVRRSYTAVVEQDAWWDGRFETEPYEVAWASELVVFVRALDVDGAVNDARASVELSPDGIHWCREGTEFDLPKAREAVTFGRVSHFGTYVRLAGTVGDGRVRVIVYFVLKE
ncbi:MAG: hypothetical protein H0U69_14380 [Trueperaceae bacterium]|nr:hypothetical protein [Trueperaceae bacterium]